MSPAARDVVELQRHDAPEARQGVAVGTDSFYAIDNSAIARHDKQSGAQLAIWQGDPRRFAHLNSCVVVDAELICANSNFPDVPQHSSVELFDARTLAWLRSVPLADGRGSLTWVDRHDGAWWAMFANYDGRGGEAPRDHRDTVLARLDDQWQETQRWHLPPAVLERLRPSSSSGGGWGPDGRLYITGHDRPKIYVLGVPADGATLDLIETIAAPPLEGQAISWDHAEPGVLYAISRRARQVIALRVLPAVRQPPARSGTSP